MNDSTIYNGDEENLINLAPALEKRTDTEHSIWITGLTDDQFEALKLAVRPDPRNRTAKIIGKVSGLSAMMVFVALCIWTVNFLLSNLTTR